VAEVTRPRASEDTGQALALVIANTRMAERPGARRPHSLTRIAEAIHVAEASYGSMKEVAGRVGISAEMLRRFLSVERLNPEVKPLVAARQIDSLNMVLYMASMPKPEQPVVAAAIINGRLSGTDVRALAPLRKRFPNSDIRKLIDRVTSSRDRTVYAVVFPLPRGQDLRPTADAMKHASGGGLLTTRSLGGRRYKAVFTRQWLKNLRAAARKLRLPFRDYMRRLLTRGTPGEKQGHSDAYRNWYSP